MKIISTELFLPTQQSGLNLAPLTAPEPSNAGNLTSGVAVMSHVPRQPWRDVSAPGLDNIKWGVG